MPLSNNRRFRLRRAQSIIYGIDKKHIINSRRDFCFKLGLQKFCFEINIAHSLGSFYFFLIILLSGSVHRSRVEFAKIGPRSGKGNSHYIQRNKRPLLFDDIKIANRQNANICLILFFNLQYSHSIFHFSPYTLTLSIHPSFRAIKNSNSYSEKFLKG